MSDEIYEWTFGEALDKAREDTDFQEDDDDEEFIKLREFIGYFNEGIKEAHREILLLNEDYFLAYDYLPLVAGQEEYTYPANICGNKMRGMIYRANGQVYVIKRFPRFNKLETLENAQEFGSSADLYRYLPLNNQPGQRRMLLVPAARETSVLSPLTPVSTHIRRWYIRNPNRIPYIGEYTNPENVLPAAVDATEDTIEVDPLVAYQTGDKVKLYLGTSSSVLPGGLAEATIYYVIANDDGTISLATSAANAESETAIDITDTGSGYFKIRVCATETIVRATVLDIPEFAEFTMEWVKANCLYKDGDPRLSGTVAKIEQQRKLMQETLAKAEDDDDDVLAMDMSAYEEMS